MSVEMSIDLKKERIRELNHRQKVRFSTLLLQKVRFSTFLLPLCSMAAAPPVCYALCQ